MEDHEGELVLEDREIGGARVRLVFLADTRVAADPEKVVRPLVMSEAGHGA